MLVYWLFRLTILLTRPLPLWLGYRVAAAVAGVCYHFFHRQRRALNENLAWVLGTNNRREVDAVARRAFRNFGKFVIDFIRFSTMTQQEVRQRLVFSQWTSFLDRVEPHMNAARIPFERLDGATRERGRVVDRFQDADGRPVMLVSLRAGGTGLNLTAADHIFLLAPWWNPAVEDQAADRAHRIGQTRPVVVHRLIARNTVEERILELHARKRALAEVALGGSGQAGGLTRDDLLALLS